jgi:predicted GIY-YIG superfamily endonuclease
MDLSFNILDWFDDNIDNLDLTRNYIYVLKLVEDRYYVGRTSNFLKRMEEHFTNQGAIYTKKYKPLKIIEVVEELTNEDERLKTLDVMEKYGWEKVRGACWCSLKIKKPNIEKNKKPKRKKQNREIIYANDNNIKELYCEKNKNIIEISDILDLSPGLIAFRLEKMNVVTRRQLSKGYFEYINSDLYNLYIEKRRRKREQKIDDIKTDNINDEKIIVDLKNIKQIIREKIINANRV